MREQACLSGDNAPMTVEPPFTAGATSLDRDNGPPQVKATVFGPSLSAKYPTVMLGEGLYSLRARPRVDQEASLPT